MSVTVPLDQMTVEEKLDLMEDVWKDLARRPENVPSPDWHRMVLAEREQRIREGSASFHELAEVRMLIRNNRK